MTPQQFKAIIDTIEQNLELNDGYTVKVMGKNNLHLYGAWNHAGDPALGVIVIHDDINNVETKHSFIRIEDIECIEVITSL